MTFQSLSGEETLIHFLTKLKILLNGRNKGGTVMPALTTAGSVIIKS